MSGEFPNYSSFRESAIIALGGAAKRGQVATLDLEVFLEQHGLSCPNGWADQIARDLEAQGLGHGLFSLGRVSFHTGGACIERADEIRDARTFLGKIKSFPLKMVGWDVFKIGLGACLGVIATKYFGS